MPFPYLSYLSFPESDFFLRHVHSWVQMDLCTDSHSVSSSPAGYKSFTLILLTSGQIGCAVSRLFMEPLLPTIETFRLKSSTSRNRRL